VADRERLVGLAGFDGNYLNIPHLLSHWHVKDRRASTPAKRLAAMCRHARQRVSPLARCLIPGFDGAPISQRAKDALWDRSFTATPLRQRQSLPSTSRHQPTAGRPRSGSSTLISLK
jgi:hypothetical protein